MTTPPTLPAGAMPATRALGPLSTVTESIISVGIRPVGAMPYRPLML